MVTSFIQDQWGSNRVVSKGRMFDPSELEGFAAVADEKVVGLVTFRVERDECGCHPQQSLGRNRNGIITSQTP